jgi:acyl carrier protein
MKAIDMKKEAIRILAEVSGTEASEIRADMDLVADLGVDSPKALQLLVRLEDELEIEISDEQAARMNSVGDILDFVTAQT